MRESPSIDEVAVEPSPRPTVRVLAVLNDEDGATVVEDDTGELASATAVERGGKVYTYRGTEARDGRWRRLFTRVTVVRIACGG